MKLRYVTNSPYCRKVAIAARLLGVQERITMVNSESDQGDLIRAHNPLNKIPLLITESGEAIFDSTVIIQYLDLLAGGGRVIPRDPRDRFKALTYEALADGIMDAIGAINQEQRWHPDGTASVEWIGHQRKKVDKGIAYLNQHPPDSTMDVGAITVATMLGYLDFRDNGIWRQNASALLSWLDRFAAATPAFAETAPGRL